MGEHRIQRLDEQNVGVRCVNCGWDFKVPFTREQQYRWIEGGELLQRAAPWLSPDSRELLISGYCGRCFDALFKHDEEDE